MPHNTRISVIDQRQNHPVADLLRAQVAGNPAPSPPRSLYIHIPFCFHKCHYCDFYSIVDTQDRQRQFTQRLQCELRALAPFAGRLTTIFVGGGTPSLLAPPLWKDLLQTLHESFDLAAIRERTIGEFTVECNPETVSAELMDVLVAGGVSRISLGAQSFRAEHLKTLERWHNPENVPKAIALARASGISRHSIDLIYAVPGQTLEHWQEDLEAATALQTEHLSCYNLTFEPQTAMTARLNKGEFQPVDEDLEVEMFLLTTSFLAARGLHRYEVSNYARPGCECRHNMAYWRQDQWLAAGPSASAHVGGLRWKNLPRLDDYLSREKDGMSFATDVEFPDQRRFLGERLMTGLRLAEGVPISEVQALAGVLDEGAFSRLSKVWERGRANGHMTSDDSRLVLTDAGILIENRITVDFLRALDPR